MKTIRVFGLLMVLSCTVSSASAQDDDIRAVVKGLFTSMFTADAEGLKAVFHDSARIGTVSADGQVRYTPASGFIAYVGKLEKGIADERFEVKGVSIDGNMASAWVPYSFYRAGVFSHCGVNHMLLTKGKNGWKILTITDTRRKDDCR
jgi:Putative lumazine-binding